MTDKVFGLSDRRTLGYTLYGPEEGQPVIYFHGTPSSRLEPSLVSAFGINLPSWLAENKIKLIAVDRPGMGVSSFNPSGNFITFADDVAELLQLLKVDKCKALGWSGGGPFALALASRYPNRVQAVFMITAFSIGFNNPGIFNAMHANKLYFGAGKNTPGVLRFLMNFFIKKGAGRTISQRITGLPNVDRTLLTDPTKMKQLSAATLWEGCKQGSKGAVYEAQLYFKDLGYHLKEIVQPVHFWWGTADNTVIRAHAEAVEQQVPKAVMHYKKDEGHLSIYIHYLQEVLETIATT